MKLQTISLTYQDRFSPSLEEEEFLDKYLKNYQQLKRRLFDRLYGRSRPSDLNQFKRDFMKSQKIGSTYYNSLKNECDMIFASQLELQKQYLDELKSKEKSIVEWLRIKNDLIKRSLHNLKTYELKDDHVAKLAKKIQETRTNIHNKKRKLEHVKRQILTANTNVKLGKKFCPTVAFGSKALARKRQHLAKNGYSSSDEWKSEWHFKRSDAAFFLGDSTEKHRNRQLKGVLDFENKSAANLDISIPEFMREEYSGRNFSLKNITLSDRTLAALREALSFSYPKQTTDKDQNKTFKETRLPVSYRIKRRMFRKTIEGVCQTEIRYYLQTILKMPKIEENLSETGAIGIDLNVDHLAIGEIDRFGNPVKAFSIDFKPFEADSEQNKAALGAIINDLCDYALEKNKPLVIEKLKLSLLLAKLKQQQHGVRAKKISSLSYAKFYAMCESICARRKIGLIGVLPGYSSQLGAINYLHLKSKITSHEAAAFVLARRGISKKDYLDISGLRCAPDERVILSSLQEGLTGPAIRKLKKISKKIDLKLLKKAYLQTRPKKHRGFELDVIRRHVFNREDVFLDSA